MIKVILNMEKMNVEEKIEKWWRKEGLVEYGNEGIREEVVYGGKEGIDGEYEEVEEGIRWEKGYIVGMMS